MSSEQELISWNDRFYLLHRLTGGLRSANKRGDLRGIAEGAQDFRHCGIQLPPFA
jgi:hypothetical protein